MSKPRPKILPIGASSRVQIAAAPAPTVPHPAEPLRQAADTVVQRGQQRDSGVGEGTTLTERRGWAFMQTLKLVRAATSARNGVPDLDSHIDAAGYAALAGECVARAGAQA